ncbi:MAG: hypothetical protein ACRDTA_18185 [Pseudonocardiaceae bacterium]
MSIAGIFSLGGGCDYNDRHHYKKHYGHHKGHYSYGGYGHKYKHHYGYYKKYYYHDNGGLLSGLL